MQWSIVASVLLFTSVVQVEGLSGPHTLRLERQTSGNKLRLSSYNAQLTSSHLGYELTFQTEVTFGNQTFSLLVDTGSSDIWVLDQGWLCLNDTSNATLPQEACAYGQQIYIPSPTFQDIPSMFFGEQLGAGWVSGIFGLEDVTLGGLSVQKQHIGLVNKSSNFRDRVYTSIVGFGYSSLTSSHNGSIVNADNTTYSNNASNL
jgi:Eukaryotic aspartyl protease